MTDFILEATGLKKYFTVKKDFFGRPRTSLRAVDGVDLKIKKGSTLGLVGESGCGKSTTGRTILRLTKPDYGKVSFQGKDIFALSKSELRKIRPKMQLIFQDPYSSLNGRMTVFELVSEAVAVHKIVPKSELRDYTEEICQKCGIAKSQLLRYPHEFSGGQRQRICIARALALKPEFVVADEPVSALDVSIQSQIINLLQDLKEEQKLSYLFISHDLSVVRHLCDDVAVMYMGKIVEKAPKSEIFANPLHPYTEALFSAIPTIDLSKKRKRIVLSGELPSAVNPPSGCPFHTRCHRCMDICKKVIPEEKQIGLSTVRCHIY